MVAALIFLGILVWLILLGYSWDSDHPLAKHFKGLSFVIGVFAAVSFFIPYALGQEDGPAVLMFAAIIGGAALLGWIASGGGKKL